MTALVMQIFSKNKWIKSELVNTFMAVSPWQKSVLAATKPSCMVTLGHAVCTITTRTTPQASISIVTIRTLCKQRQANTRAEHNLHITSVKVRNWSWLNQFTKCKVQVMHTPVLEAGSNKHFTPVLSCPWLGQVFDRSWYDYEHKKLTLNQVLMLCFRHCYS